MQVAVFEAVNAIVGDYEPYLGSVTRAAGRVAGSGGHRRRASRARQPASGPGREPRRAAHRFARGGARRPGQGPPASRSAKQRRSRCSPSGRTTARTSTCPTRLAPSPASIDRRRRTSRPRSGPDLGQVSTFAIESGAQFRVPPPPALRSRALHARLQRGEAGRRRRQQRAPDGPRRCRTLLRSQRRRADLLPGGATGEPGARQDAGRERAHLRAARHGDLRRRGRVLRQQVLLRLLASGDGDPASATPTATARPMRIANWARVRFDAAVPELPVGARLASAARRGACSSACSAPTGTAITLANPLVPDVVLHYTSWKQITDDIDDARIYGGVHYRFDQEEAARQGQRVGRYVLRHWLRPVHGCDDDFSVHECAGARQRSGRVQ